MSDCRTPSYGVADADGILGLSAHMVVVLAALREAVSWTTTSREHGPRGTLSRVCYVVRGLYQHGGEGTRRCNTVQKSIALWFWDVRRRIWKQ